MVIASMAPNSLRTKSNQRQSSSTMSPPVIQKVKGRMKPSPLRRDSNAQTAANLLASGGVCFRLEGTPRHEIPLWTHEVKELRSVPLWRQEMEELRNALRQEVEELRNDIRKLAGRYIPSYATSDCQTIKRRELAAPDRAN